jgi:leucyl-tRNA synthetase
MEAINDLYKFKAEDQYQSTAWRFALESLLQLLAPFAPHISEELWHQLGHESSIHQSNWPAYDEKYLVEDTVTIAVQVNGKLRGQIEMPIDADQPTVEVAAKAEPNVTGHLEGKTVVKTIYVPGKIVNIVVR